MQTFKRSYLINLLIVTLYPIVIKKGDEEKALALLFVSFLMRGYCKILLHIFILLINKSYKAFYFFWFSSP